MYKNRFISKFLLFSSQNKCDVHVFKFYFLLLLKTAQTKKTFGNFPKFCNLEVYKKVIPQHSALVTNKLNIRNEKFYVNRASKLFVSYS